MTTSQAHEDDEGPEAGEALDRLIHERILGSRTEVAMGPYSTDWDAGQALREQCAAHSMTKLGDAYLARVAVRRERFTTMGEARGETPALALCRAALVSVERAERARREFDRSA